MTTAARVGRPRRAGVTAHVLAATRDLIGDQGYARTSVEQIAAAAGVAKTTIYRRWRTKSALAVDAWVDVLGPLPTPEGEWPAGLVATISWLVDRIRDPSTHRLLQGLMSEAAYDPALREQLWARIRIPYQDMLMARWGVDRSDANLAFDVVVGTILNNASMNGAVSPATVEAVASLAAGVLLPGTRTGRARRPRDEHIGVPAPE